MNGYLIVCGEKKYATHAENIMEAEEKLAAEVNENFDKCEITLIDDVLIQELEEDLNVTFF